MNKNEIEFKMQIYYAMYAFISLTGIFGSLISVIIYIGYYFHNRYIAYLGLSIIYISLYSFRRKILNLFTRNVTLQFNENYFLIKEYSMKNNDQIKDLQIDWHNLESYNLYFAQDKYLALSLQYKNKRKRTYVFKGIKNENDNIDNTKLYRLFIYYIKQFNSKNEIAEQIVLKMGFLASKSGTLILYMLLIMAMIAIVLHIFIQPKTSFGTIFISISFLLGLLAKRMDEKRNYIKICDLYNSDLIEF